MRWSLTHSTNQLHFWKMEEDECNAEIKYNEQVKSFRLTAGDKRLFFIERAGFLQNKYILRTEYSIVAGEVYPEKNWRSGIAIMEDKKSQYLLKDNLLALSSKKENFSLTIEVNDSNNLNPSELFALLFSSLRVLTKSHAANLY